MPHHLPAPHEIISLSAKLDINLANIAGDRRTREFIILAGSYIEFCKVGLDSISMRWSLCPKDVLH